MSESDSSAMIVAPITNNTSSSSSSSFSSSSSTVSKKRKVRPFHNIHTHSNPLNDNRFHDTPYVPDDVNYHLHYPAFYPKDQEVPEPRPLIEFADIGCGFGGLLFGLSPLFPKSLILGMEIRAKAVEYVHDKIIAAREKSTTGEFQNISVLQSNAMKYLPAYFRKGQLKKIFFLFPDPHFKKSTHRRRIISPTLLAEYAYVLAVGGLAYTISDVKDLSDWMVKHLSEHPLFERVSDEDLEKDPVVPVVRDYTEEGKKVTRSGGKKYLAVFRRIEA